MSTTRFSRRDSMRFLGAGALAGLFSGVARGDAPADAKPQASSTENLQGAGFYRTMVGATEVILVSDGTFAFSPGLLGANAPAGAVDKALDDLALKPEAALAHVNVMLINLGSRKVLVDTGCGSLFGPTTGFALKHLERAGIKPADISDVFITHLHPDHIGGLLGDAGTKVLPNATFHMHETEHAFWSGPNPDLSKVTLDDEFKKTVTTAARKLIDLVGPNLKLVKQGEKLATELEVVHLPGHTPGHSGLRLGSGADSMLYVTDAVHFPLIQFDHPDWYVAFDTDRDQAVETRKKILDQASTDKSLIAGAHLIFPALGRLRKRDATFDWRGTIWKW
ncbi:MAG: MBL fold metallo-hydrolase [Tepidisphaeraceae bacterium]